MEGSIFSKITGVLIQQFRTFHEFAQSWRNKAVSCCYEKSRKISSEVFVELLQLPRKAISEYKMARLLEFSSRWKSWEIFLEFQLPWFTVQKMKFSIKDFFSKCDQILRKLWIRSHLLRKSLMENFIFCAVFQTHMINLFMKIVNSLLSI